MNKFRKKNLRKKGKTTKHKINYGQSVIRSVMRSNLARPSQQWNQC